MDDPFFAPFFQNMSPFRKRVENSLGSGFIASPTGLIVTNAHVIENAEEIVVVLSDGREFEARSVLIDAPSDVGLLRINAGSEELPVVTMSPSETLEVGDLVLAIGNPFGVGQTVTSGIVSALARSNTDINDYDFFIQTDAAINPGNSGGPLVNMDGGVIGVNSAIYSRSGGSLGIGFAVPSEMVQAVIAAEKSGQIGKGGVVRPWLGFTAQNVTSDIAQSMGLIRPAGALVATIAKDGPAEKSGLKTGDVILAINDRAIRDADELKFRIATIPLQQTAKLKIQRAGAEQVITFTASPPPEVPARAPVTIDGNNPLAGATLVNVSPAVIEEMGLRGMEDGVVVQDVQAGTIAARMGLKTGDGNIAIGNHAVGSTDEVQGMLDRADTRRGWVLTIRRNGRDQTLILR
jgi:serine protease Do